MYLRKVWSIWSYLLQVGDVTSDVLDRHWILHAQLVALAFHSGSLNENTGVSGQASEGHRNVVVKAADLSYSSVVLEHSNGLLLDA